MESSTVVILTSFSMWALKTLVVSVDTVVSDVDTVVSDVDTVVSDVDTVISTVDTVVSDVDTVVSDVDTVVSDVDIDVSAAVTVVVVAFAEVDATKDFLLIDMIETFQMEIICSLNIIWLICLNRINYYINLSQVIWILENNYNNNINNFKNYQLIHH